MFEATINNGKTYQVDFDTTGILLNGNRAEVDIVETDQNVFQVLYKGQSMQVVIHEVNEEDKTVLLSVDGKKNQVALTTEMDRLLKKMGIEAGASRKTSEIKAPMPGLIHTIHVKPGDEVKKGDQVLILEAMKMENVIKSPTDGVIKKVHVEEKATVDKGAIMLSFE